MTGLASPSRGARETSAWLVRFAPGHRSPAHSLTREETFLVLSGSVTAHFDDRVETAGPGDALIVPADARFLLVAGADLPRRSASCLKMPDCCVLLAAESSGAAVACFDDRLTTAAEKRGLSVWRG